MDTMDLACAVSNCGGTVIPRPDSGRAGSLTSRPDQSPASDWPGLDAVLKELWKPATDQSETDLPGAAAEPAGSTLEEGALRISTTTLTTPMGSFTPSTVEALLRPRYRPICLVGAGAQGEVWFCYDNRDERYVVVKLCRCACGQRELEAVGKVLALEHENLIEILAVEKSAEEGVVWYAMPAADDLTSGQFIFDGTYLPATLENVFKHSAIGRLSAEECLTIGIALCGGLVFLHVNGYIHRDIKPSNTVLIRGVWKLADIGFLAGIGSQTFVGTYPYTPPEGPGKPTADVYSLGVLLYVILTGDLSLDDRERRIAEMSGDSLRDRLMAIIARATEPEVSRRYASAADMMRELTQTRSDLSGIA
jgi:serine/threonine protein kinase